MKGLSIEEKRGAIQRRLVEKLKRFPSLFDEEIFFLMQRLFLAKGLSFKRDRKARQVGEILSLLYLLEKKVERKMEEEPYRRHLFIKLLSRQIELPIGNKKVLAVFVGMNLLKEHELFSKDSLIQGIKSSFPKAHFVEGSDFLFVDEEKKIRLLYLEMDREGNRSFSLPELKRLKEQLPLSLKRRITQLLPPLFMPRNEEELLRHLITLSHELKFAKTLPQVILSFDKETDQDLFFTVILARLVFPKSPSIEELLDKLSFSLSPTLERIKILGTLRKKYFKEGVIFKVRLSLTQFIREDSAVDLYAARHYLLSEIEKGFGKVRDFNGGIISKQTEALKELKKLFRGLKKEEILLLEIFFHALFPIEKRGLIELSKLKKFFLLFLKQVRVEEEKGKLREIDCEEDLGSLYILIDSVELPLERKMKEVTTQR
ncbi:MAG: hypothetical protein HYZ47_03505 [Simkania negevensis]|nr:hypothetical protein [Simkania negevensis]